MDQPTYEAFLKQMSCLSHLRQQEDSRPIIQHFKAGQRLPSRYAPVVYLVDYTTHRYIYADEACLDLFGYTAKEFLEGGLDWYVSKWHPVDFEVINKKVFPACLHFLQSLSLERYSDFIFSYNYRALNAKGDYITILQRSSFIPGNVPGKPLGNIGVAFDITHFKTDLSIVHTIEEVLPCAGTTVNEVLYKKVYPVEDMGALGLSKRELEILKWMAEGFSSKQIADTLCLSIHTINNHRKNMLYKTGCKTPTELLSYALKHGYL